MCSCYPKNSERHTASAKCMVTQGIMCITAVDVKPYCLHHICKQVQLALYPKRVVQSAQWYRIFCPRRLDRLAN